jgi:hypothetical protein
VYELCTAKFNGHNAHSFTVVLLQKKIIKKINYLVLSRKTFQLLDAGTSGNVRNFLLKIFRSDHIIRCFTPLMELLLLPEHSLRSPAGRRSEYWAPEASLTLAFLYVKCQTIKNWSIVWVGGWLSGKVLA